MTEPPAVLEIGGGVAHVTLSQPGRGNPFDWEFCRELSRIATECDENDGAAAADFCLAARSARFYAGYTGIGLPPDGGGSAFLPHRIGVRRTAEFLMRNQTWTAAQALEYGLVSEVVKDAALPAAARALAAELAQGPTKSFGEIKNLLLSTWEQPIEAQMEREARAMARVCRTDDALAGITDVAARRVPQFRGH